jgi:hypothetical protein
LRQFRRVYDLEVNVGEDSATWNYEAGPSDAMKQEIGQVVINHALCDPALYSLFHALSGINEATAKVMVRALRLKSGGLIELIKSFKKEKESQIHPELSKRISECLLAYDQLSKARNLIAHWQWGLSASGEDNATTSNFLGMNHGDPSADREHTLRSLKATSWGLMQVNVLMALVSSFIAGNIPDTFIELALSGVDEVLNKTRQALLDIPDVSAEELP